MRALRAKIRRHQKRCNIDHDRYERLANDLLRLAGSVLGTRSQEYQELRTEIQGTLSLRVNTFLRAARKGARVIDTGSKIPRIFQIPDPRQSPVWVRKKLDELNRHIGTVLAYHARRKQTHARKGH